MAKQVEMTWGSNSSSGYPSELLKNMRPDDDVVAFIKIEERNVGCLKKKPKGHPTDSYFLAITRERVVGTVETRRKEKTGLFSSANHSNRITFNIPIVKITSITTSSSSVQSGCLKKSNNSRYELIINAQGDELAVYTGKDSSVNDEFVRSFLEISDYF